MCCFGTVPKINEWISIKMEDGAEPIMDQAVTLMGQLKVGEDGERLPRGYYEMLGDKMIGPLTSRRAGSPVVNK